MTKEKLSQDEEVSKYCFAAFPLTIKFQEECNKKLHLYLQKNLQIIAKYQTDNLQMEKEEIYRFQMASVAQTFRACSLKKLCYNLSLYEIEKQNGTQRQLYIESQEMLVKSIWDKWKVRRQPYYLTAILFSKIKFKITFLITISSSNKQALSCIQDYYQYKMNQNIMSYLINIKNSKGKDIIQNQYKMKSKKYSEDNVNRDKSLQKLTQKQKTESHKQPLNNNGYTQSNTSLKNQPEHFGTPTKHNHLDKPDQNAIKLFYLRGSPSFGHEGDHPLTASEKKMGNVIEQIVRDSSSPQRRVNNQHNLTKQNGKHIICSPAGMASKYKAITKSQYIDCQGKLVIIPFYKQTKYLFIIVAILFIFSFLILMRPEFKNYEITKKQKIHLKKMPKQESKKANKYSKKKNDAKHY